MKALIATVLTMLSTSALGQPEPREFTPEEIKIVEGAVRDSLNDPDSGRFRWPKNRDVTPICAQVNAKNLYGGYTGFKFFIIDVDRDATGHISRIMGNPILIDPSSIDYSNTAESDALKIALDYCSDAIGEPRK